MATAIFFEIANGGLPYKIPWRRRYPPLRIRESEYAAWTLVNGYALNMFYILNSEDEGIEGIKSFWYLFPFKSQDSIDNLLLELYKISQHNNMEVLLYTQQWLSCSYKSEAQVANLAQMLEEVEFFESLDGNHNNSETAHAIAGVFPYYITQAVFITMDMVKQMLQMGQGTYKGVCDCVKKEQKPEEDVLFGIALAQCRSRPRAIFAVTEHA
ncbi:unnamed protein product [Cochlearia groenlandica]